MNPTHKKMKTNIITKVQEVLNNMRRTDKHPGSRTELAAHTQILNQQTQLNGRNHHISAHINTEHE
jgi:pyruvate/oxaloacetate carboxyltransferase